jgi:DNA polymerase-3 subunit alpha
MPEAINPEKKINQKGRQIRLAGIASFKAFRPKTALQDIGKVLAMKSSEVNQIAEFVSYKPGENLKKIIQDIPELRQIMKSGTKQQQKLLSLASIIDGLVESVQVHSGSKLLFSEDSMDVIPFYRDAECEMVSQYGMSSLEALGFAKKLL